LRSFDALLDALAAVAASVIGLLMLGICADVVCRWVLSASILWIFEASEYSLVIIPFLGMPWLAREHGHISVEVLVDTLPATAKLQLQRAISALLALVCFFLAFWALVLACNDFSSGIRTAGIYPIARFFLPSLVAFGMLLTGIEFALQALLKARQARPPSHDDGEIA
jgi:TRAP-type C4-dicarboxylate transport system permease small subunit